MKIEKYFFQISISFFLFLISINEIKNFRCGADDLKIKPKELKFNNTYSKKISNEVKDTGYTPIKIGMDYTNFTKPSSMNDETFNKIKNIISDSLEDFKTFLQIQHVDLDLNGLENEIKENCELQELSSDYRNFLINNDVIVFPFFTDELGTDTLGAARPCLTLKKVK